jgi:hypothetical protein
VHRGATGGVGGELCSGRAGRDRDRACRCEFRAVTLAWPRATSHCMPRRVGAPLPSWAAWGQPTTPHARTVEANGVLHWQAVQVTHAEGAACTGKREGKTEGKGRGEARGGGERDNSGRGEERGLSAPRPGRHLKHACAGVRNAPRPVCRFSGGPHSSWDSSRDTNRTVSLPIWYTKKDTWQPSFSSK